MTGAPIDTARMMVPKRQLSASVLSTESTMSWGSSAGGSPTRPCWKSCVQPTCTPFQIAARARPKAKRISITRSSREKLKERSARRSGLAEGSSEATSGAQRNVSGTSAPIAIIVRAAADWPMKAAVNTWAWARPKCEENTWAAAPSTRPKTKPKDITPVTTPRAAFEAETGKGGRTPGIPRQQRSPKRPRAAAVRLAPMHAQSHGPKASRD